MPSALARWLATLDADDLAEILHRRPDATAAPAPASLAQLATRLERPEHITAVLRTLPLPALQLVEAIQALHGPAVPQVALAEFVGRAPDDADLAATLRVLVQRALVWPDRADLRMAAPLWSAFAYPLRLGTPAQHLLETLPEGELRAVARRLGVPAGGSKRAAVAALGAWLADGDAVRTAVGAAPPAVRRLLTDLARQGPLLHAGYGGAAAPEVAWAVDRGLLAWDGWQHAQLPYEVGIALRGPDWRAPFDPQPPSCPPVPADPGGLETEAAAAAAAALAQVSDLLESCEHTGVTLLKAGGVGSRELRRLAKVLGAAEEQLPLWLELLHTAGLLGVIDGRCLPTEAYDDWRGATPAGRLALLLSSWRRMAATPLAGHQTPLRRDGTGLTAPELRGALLHATAELPPGAGASGVPALTALLAWRLPLLIEPHSGGEAQVEALLGEAVLLGVVAHGALTPLGRALLAGPAEVAEVGARLLPDATTQALFQADLTAVVPGTPAAALAELLDGAADRESRGGATTWRFSAGSVRRALDAGRPAAELLAGLRTAAVGGALPQVLEYLVVDVARRHGAVRARAVGCVLRAEDPALLTELAGARALRPLHLAVLAPTVLASGRPLAETLATLRAAGYAPVGEGPDGGALIERAPRRRAPVARRAGRGGPPDPRALAGSLLAAGLGEPAAPPAGLEAAGLEAAGLGAAAPGAAAPGANVVELRAGPMPVSGADQPAEVRREVSRYASHLTPYEQRLLASAITEGAPLRIDYTSAAGDSSTRVIEPLDLDRHLLTAWCRLREDERVFALDRIDAVSLG